MPGSPRWQERLDAAVAQLNRETETLGEEMRTFDQSRAEAGRQTEVLSKEMDALSRRMDMASAQADVARWALPPALQRLVGPACSGCTTRRPGTRTKRVSWVQISVAPLSSAVSAIWRSNTRGPVTSRSAARRNSRVANA